MAGLLPKVVKGKGWNGQGALLVNKSNDPHEYDLSEEEMTILITNIIRDFGN
jgi:hypothetical protein